MLNRLLLNPIAFIIITALSLVFSLSLYRSAQQTKQSTQSLQALEDEVRMMEKEVATLEQAAQAAQQPFAKEKIIRDQLLMQKPGEYVVQIPATLTPTQPAPSSLPTPQPWSAWSKILF